MPTICSGNTILANGGDGQLWWVWLQTPHGASSSIQSLQSTASPKWPTGTYSPCLWGTHPHTPSLARWLSSPWPPRNCLAYMLPYTGTDPLRLGGVVRVRVVAMGNTHMPRVITANTHRKKCEAKKCEAIAFAKMIGVGTKIFRVT